MMIVHSVIIIIVTILTRYDYGQYGFYSSRGTRYLLHLLPPIERVRSAACCGHCLLVISIQVCAAREAVMFSTLATLIIQHFKI